MIKIDVRMGSCSPQTSSLPIRYGTAFAALAVLPRTPWARFQVHDDFPPAIFPDKRHF
jgi:hypothetical protein